MKKVLVRQIRVDLPRTNAGCLHNLFQHPKIHEMMQNILFVWAIRHPACGYVQGINDILTPFLITFLSSAFETDPKDINMEKILGEKVRLLEKPWKYQVKSLETPKL